MTYFTLADLDPGIASWHDDDMTTNTTHDISLGTALVWFGDQQERGDISRRTREVAMKRYAQSGGHRTWFVKDGWRFTISNDAIACDCGKGIYCPLVKQRREAR